MYYMGDYVFCIQREELKINYFRLLYDNWKPKRKPV